jgi:hypothetical protein
MNAVRTTTAAKNWARTRKSLCALFNETAARGHVIFSRLALRAPAARLHNRCERASVSLADAPREAAYVCRKAALNRLFAQRLTRDMAAMEFS